MEDGSQQLSDDLIGIGIIGSVHFSDANPDELVERPNPRHAPHLTEHFSQNQMQSCFIINQREKGENLFLS